MDSNTSGPSRPKSRQSIAHMPSSTAFPKNKENVTADVSSLSELGQTGRQNSKKKLRSKSLGPGGIEALQETAGNRVKIPATLQVKSILKPTIPLTPPKIIPSFDDTSKRSTGKSREKSPSKNGGEDLLIDFSTPAPSQINNSASISVSGSENVLDPFSPIANLQSPKGKSIALIAEKEEESAAQDREAEERRQSEKQAILDRRAARRKSMANRRVSFAPEATLHTWNVIELVEDSTTSSASNSTRRQSSMTNAQSPPKNAQSPTTRSDARATPSTPEEQAETTLVQASPAHQRNLHQKKSRRGSSGVPPMDFNNPNDEDFSSSPCSGSSAADVESSPARVEDSIHSDDETDADADTAMTMDEETAQTLTSQDSGSSTQSSLDERLRKAATQAGTRGIEYDENGDDLSMEMATGTITNAFQPWVQKATQPSNQYLSSLQDQENLNPFSPAFKAQLYAHQPAEAEPEDETQDMSMDVTAAVGGILPGKASPNKGRRKSVVASRRRSSVARRRSSGTESNHDDETMEFTTVRGGGIIQQHQAEKLAHPDDGTDASDEEMTMEFTNVVGGVLNGYVESHRDSTESAPMDETMDMTAAVGGILPPIEESTEPQTYVEEDETVGMDITTAMGKILPPGLVSTNKAMARQLMEEESDGVRLGNSPLTRPAESASPPRTASSDSTHVSTSVASETGSPSLALKPRLSGRGRSGLRQSTTPQVTPSRHSTPVKKPAVIPQTTPTKQLTPLPNRAETPNKTPIAPNVTNRGASPKKLFKAEIKAKASPASAQKSVAKQKTALFDHNEETGQRTPSVVLHAPKPHQHLRRRSSGLGIDKEGLGSPRVTALLDRRESIGDVAAVFVPDSRKEQNLRFDDPKVVEDEIDAEREEEQRRESGRFVMEQEADRPTMQEDENTTTQLKEMIESLTPKKNKPSKLKGRKSLHVGAARGILGKRPPELDLDDEDDEGETTPKRLKAVEREASPVKKIHLPKPPSKDETTGRITRALRQSLGEVTGNITITPTLSQSPGKSSALNTPRAKGRFKEATLEPNNRPASFENKLDNVMDAIDISTAQSQQEGEQEDDPEQEEKIPLQAFLNMTNIHFIELSTTKRRNTIAPTTLPSDPSQPVELQECFSAAATTLPLLELYQHATRELKSYISTGRRIIRSIEAETLEEQPPLFREYVDAPPDIKMVMDNQFRNGKAHARLQSKAGWYAWRGQLVDGLRGGLEGIRKGMEEDAEKLAIQERILQNLVPSLTNRHAELEEVARIMLQRKDEMNSIDHEALRETRSQLSDADEDVARKEALLKNLQAEVQHRNDAFVAAEEMKVELRSQIEEAERVREECRGWSPTDVHALKQKVDELEKETGWSVVTAEEDADESNEFGVALALRYKDTLRLFFHPYAFQEVSDNQGGRRRSRRSKSDSRPSAPISLIYSPKEDEAYSSSPDNSTERRFFLQLLRSQLHAFAAMSRGTISCKTVLATVASGWDMALRVAEEVRQLNMAGITSVSILGDEKLGATTMMLLPTKGRVDIEFALNVSVTTEGTIDSATSVTAKGAYGSIAGVLANGPRSSKVQQALSKEIESKTLGSGAWFGAIRGFEEWCANISNTATTTTTQPKRSPLKEKKTPLMQKKSIPVPQQHQLASDGIRKADIAAASSVPSKLPVLLQSQPQSQQTQEEFKSKQQMTNDDAEAERMRTPFRRMGGLRRSPDL